MGIIGTLPLDMPPIQNRPVTKHGIPVIGDKLPGGEFGLKDIGVIS